MPNTDARVKFHATYTILCDGDPMVIMHDFLTEAKDDGEIYDFQILSEVNAKDGYLGPIEFEFSADVVWITSSEILHQGADIANKIVHDTDATIEGFERVA